MYIRIIIYIKCIKNFNKQKQQRQKYETNSKKQQNVVTLCVVEQITHKHIDSIICNTYIHIFFLFHTLKNHDTIYVYNMYGLNCDFCL